MKRRLVYCRSLGNGVILECHDGRVEWLLPARPCGAEDDVYIELAMREGECSVNQQGPITRAYSARCIHNSHLYWVDGKFSFIKDEVEEHALHPMEVLLLITDPRAVEHTYLNAVTREHRVRFSDALKAMRDHGVYLVDVKSNEHTVDLEFNSIVFTILKGE